MELVSVPSHPWLGWKAYRKALTTMVTPVWLRSAFEIVLVEDYLARGGGPMATRVCEPDRWIGQIGLVLEDYGFLVWITERLGSMRRTNALSSGAHMRLLVTDDLTSREPRFRTTLWRGHMGAALSSNGTKAPWGRKVPTGNSTS